MKTSVQKTKTMIAIGKYPLQTKIVLDNKNREQVSHFHYFVCDMIYDVGYDGGHDLTMFQSINGKIRRLLSRKTIKETGVNFTCLLYTSRCV